MRITHSGNTNVPIPDQRVLSNRPSAKRMVGSPRRGAGLETWGCTLGRAAGAPGTLGRVELDWLETFLAVVDRGGFTAASEQIHRSQSRVSAHIAALERHLGVQLIDRSRRPAVAT